MLTHSRLIPDTRLVLDRVVLREIRLPLKERFRISSGAVSERRILLLELHDADGVSAWSECVAGESPNYSPETIDTAWLALSEWIAPLVLQHDPAEPNQIHQMLHHVRGHEMAKAAIEMGCWALAASRNKIALAELLRGTQRRIRVGISLGIQDSPETLVQRAVAAQEAGYGRIKLKIMPGADLEYVAAVRSSLPAVNLMADANSAYTLADADHLAKLDAFELVMIEQPLEQGDLLRHAELQKRLRTPICLDESITSLARAQDMIALGSGRIINIKPGRVGGYAIALAIHNFARQHAIPVWCGGMLESGIGRAYNVALASLPNFTLPGDVSPSARYWQRDVVIPEWTMSAEGFIDVPFDRPGLGVEVDAGYIDQLTVRSRVLKAPMT